MIILGIESSCDETGVAVLSDASGRIQILSNIVSSSASLQANFGGVIPDQAAREQLKYIIPAIESAINDARLTISDIDAIAVTYGPGLIGSLLIGVETAKTLSLFWGKPLIPVNHLLGHFYANFIGENIPSFPAVGLLVSGGHTDLVLFKDHNNYEYLGGTLDDAAGECFDKCARLLGLPYPGGALLSKLADEGKDTYNLPRPMIYTKDFNFSFSGLKTAALNITKSKDFSEKNRANLACSIEAAIIDTLVKKTLLAAKKYGVEQIIVAGGVAANRKLVKNLQSSEFKIHVPEPALCTDNGAMIAAAAFFSKDKADPLKLQANPNLSLR